MNATKEQIQSGVMTIRALRELAREDALSISRACDAYKPKYRAYWGAALKSLGVVKEDKSSGQGHVDKSYWNQKDCPYDYDLFVAIHEYCSSANKVSNAKSNYTTSAKTELKLEKQKNDAYISFDHLSMTEEEYWKLVKEYGRERVEDILYRIKNYKKNKNYKSLYLTAMNWLRNDFRKSIQGYWGNDKSGALNDEQKNDLFSQLEKMEVPKLESTLKLKKSVVEEVKDSPTLQPDTKPRTKWLKIFGIKIYEKPIL